MAVYTPLSERALRQHLRPFRVGELIDARGVSAGTINTIYEVNTTRGHYILRILENRTVTDARFEEALLHRLHEQGLMVPQMLGAGKQGSVISITPRQQLSVFQYLPGREVGVFEITPAHTAQVGTFLASMHQAARGLGRRRRNRFDPPNLARIVERCKELAPPGELQRDIDRLQEALERYAWPRDLPRGIVHGDLFIDNVRFAGGELCGVLDFEMACTGPLLYDLAVAIGDWAFMHDQFLPERAAALVGGYEAKRPLKPIEHASLYALCLYSTVRFAITRFYDFEIRRRPEATRLYKDYRHFLSRLVALQKLGESAFVGGVLTHAAIAAPATE